MKKILALVAVLAFSVVAFAQEHNAEAPAGEQKMEKTEKTTKTETKHKKKSKKHDDAAKKDEKKTEEHHAE